MAIVVATAEFDCQLVAASTTTKAPDRAANVVVSGTQPDGDQMGSPTFQPRFDGDRYPIGRFILERSRALGIGRTDLVRRLSYRDIGSGHKTLSAVLLTGVLPPHVEKHLAEALEVDRKSVV